MSFGEGFHDIRSIENCLNDGVQFIHEYKEYLKDSIQIDKEYVKNKLSIINKYKTKQEKRYTLPELTTSHRSWIVFLGNMEKKCEDRMNILEKFTSDIVEPLKFIINRGEEEKKKQISFYKKLNTFVDRYCQENEKNSMKYHESCDIVMASKKKCDKKQDKLDKSLNKSCGELLEVPEKGGGGAASLSINTKNLNTSRILVPSALPSALPTSLMSALPTGNQLYVDDNLFPDMDDTDNVESNSSDKKKIKKGKKILNPLIKMNNKKNFYVMSLKVANALRNKFFEEDTPFVFNELQSINESMYKSFKDICIRQMQYERELSNIYNERDEEIMRSLNSINIPKDTEIYIRCYSKEWNKPEIIPFIPTTHWEDKEELVIDGPTSIVLKNMIQKGKERLDKIDLGINSKTSEFNKFEMLCNSYNNSNPNYTFGEIDVIKNKKNDIMQNIIMANNIKLICKVQINEISKYIENEPKPERQHLFKPKKIINPTICDYCKEKLWGKAYTCKLCTFSCHIKCELKVPLECNGVKTKRKSLRINCSQLSDGSQNVSSPFKFKPSFGIGNIAKIKEEDEMSEGGNIEEERLNKNDFGELSERSLLKYTVKNEANKSKLNQSSEFEDKMNNSFSCNFKEILWYIDNNEFPSITADSMVDMPTIGELIKKNSIMNHEEIELLQSKQKRSSSEYTSDSFQSVNIPNSRSCNKIRDNSINPSTSNTLNSINEICNENDILGNETISIIDTNNISSNDTNDGSEDFTSDNDTYDSAESNDNTNKNNSLKFYNETMNDEPLKGKDKELEIDFDANPGPMKNLTYQLSKSKSLPMLYYDIEEEEEEEGDNEEKKTKLAIERRNSYLREKFYLKNNIVNRPQEETFTKMIAMYDYQHQSDDELDLSSNEEVTLVIPDDGSGWAMVSSEKGCGLVPANYLMECAQVNKDFIPDEEEEEKITVKAGDVLLILEKDDGSGYTKVRVKDKEGLIPSNYVSPIS
ncbi:hypothetical protein BCR36DRAFT_355014 [Piromyces finnis]|uniref:SH3 domain-containing protein n=1 Tax=Piromyces finnis TaxID=1754191 RepID=A0A1Y1V782_9FUNG|nr:hypothetical protein BCR36DRAFT_355014 [Piromyces finnis]|eukprot:ORX48134.1 hypothetical protein BCR36DRAFT_355014 [Piromyces finnis]